MRYSAFDWDVSSAACPAARTDTVFVVVFFFSCDGLDVFVSHGSRYTYRPITTSRPRPLEVKTGVTDVFVCGTTFTFKGHQIMCPAGALHMRARTSIFLFFYFGDQDRISLFGASGSRDKIRRFQDEIPLLRRLRSVSASPRAWESCRLFVGVAFYASMCTSRKKTRLHASCLRNSKPPCHTLSCFVCKLVVNLQNSSDVRT